MKKIITHIVFAFALTTSMAQISQIEKDALTDLYEATNGENWVNSWDLKTPVTNWHGITVANNNVIGIQLLFNNLEGEIPHSIGNLKKLEKLELSFNNINGEIPESIGSLNNLKVFAVNGNHLEGNIPGTIGNLENLEQIHLSSNQLKGQIPLNIGNLQQLKTFNVFDNNLSGVIPFSLLSNESLKKLVISENNFSNIEAFVDVMLFESDVDSQFKVPTNSTIKPKTVIANEVSDDEN